MMQHRKRKTSRRSQRRGSLYIAVMGMTLVVSTIGMSVMISARLNLRATTASNNFHEARLLADAAIEAAIVDIRDDPNWRTTLQNDVEFPATPISLGAGSYTAKVVDADGDLTDNVADTVRLYGIGRVGQITYTTSVLLEPKGVGLGCLTAAAHCADWFNVNHTDDVMTPTSGPLSTNSKMQNQATVDGDVECEQLVAGGAGTITGLLTESSPLKAMPDANVFDYYETNGTTVDITSLPVGGAGFDRSINGQLISPVHNPFGGQANSLGIYVIDCLGQHVEIQKSRIYGTLVLLNAGSATEIGTEVSMEAAVANFPCLLVQGDFNISSDRTILLSEATESVNFNPTGAPYFGIEDSDQTDTYPTRFRGLVYASGTVTLFGSPRFESVLVAGVSINTNAATAVDVEFNYQDFYFNNPPPGFMGGGAMEIQAGSWRRDLSN